MATKKGMKESEEKPVTEGRHPFFAAMSRHKMETRWSGDDLGLEIPFAFDFTGHHMEALYYASLDAVDVLYRKQLASEYKSLADDFWVILHPDGSPELTDSTTASPQRLFAVTRRSTSATSSPAEIPRAEARLRIVPRDGPFSARSRLLMWLLSVSASSASRSCVSPRSRRSSRSTCPNTRDGVFRSPIGGTRSPIACGLSAYRRMRYPNGAGATKGGRLMCIAETNGRLVCRRAWATLLAGCLLALLPFPSWAQLHKCKNASGKLVYSDRPCENESQTIKKLEGAEFTNRSTSATCTGNAYSRDACEMYRKQIERLKKCDNVDDRFDSDLARKLSDTVYELDKNSIEHAARLKERADVAKQCYEKRMKEIDQKQKEQIDRLRR